MKPRNIAAMQRARERGDVPEVVVSLTGQREIRDAVHVFADPGRAYDWSDLAGVHVIIATRPGLDSRNAIAGIFKAADEHDTMHTAGYPTIMDTERRQVAHVYQLAPLRVMQPRTGSTEWAAYFAS